MQARPLRSCQLPACRQRRRPCRPRPRGLRRCRPCGRARRRRSRQRMARLTVRQPLRRPHFGGTPSKPHTERFGVRRAHWHASHSSVLVSVCQHRSRDACERSVQQHAWLGSSELWRKGTSRGAVPQRRQPQPRRRCLPSSGSPCRPPRQRARRQPGHPPHLRTRQRCTRARLPRPRRAHPAATRSWSTSTMAPTTLCLPLALALPRPRPCTCPRLSGTRRPPRPRRPRRRPPRVRATSPQAPRAHARAAPRRRPGAAAARLAARARCGARARGWMRLPRPRARGAAARRSPAPGPVAAAGPRCWRYAQGSLLPDEQAPGRA